jgi:hypothetical protein
VAHERQTGDGSEVVTELLEDQRTRQRGRGGWHQKDAPRQRIRRVLWRQGIPEQNGLMHQRFGHQRAVDGHGFRIKDYL